METLNRVRAQMHQLFRGEASIEQVALSLGAAPERLALYARFVREHVRGVVDKNYPYLARVVGQPLWRQWVEAYERATPSSHWELNSAAEGFPEFLRQRLIAREPGLLAFHVELATYEWEEFAVYTSTAQVPDATPQPTLNPSLAALSFEFPVHSYVEALRRSVDVPPLPGPGSEPHIVLLFQHPPSFELRHLIATPRHLLALKVAQEGLSPSAVAVALGQPMEFVETLLSEAAQEGFLLWAPSKPE